CQILRVKILENALHELYYNPSMSCKDTAQKWLMKAQRSAEAWQFAWNLLGEGKTTEVQHFGASSLSSKINSSWKDISEDDVEVLKCKLYEQLLRFSVTTDKKIILTRLCVAFSAFVFNCGNQNLWPNAVHDIIEKIKSDNTATLSQCQRCSALLEILTVLPEECLSANTEKYKKGNMMHLLRNGFLEVVELLKSVSYADDSNQVKVIKCLSSWVALGTPLNECEELLVQVLGCIEKPELFDSSVECMLNTFCSPRLHDYPNTVKKLTPLVLSLHPMFTKAVKDEDSDTILGLTKLVCSLAENHTKFVLETFSDNSVGWGLTCFVMDCLVLNLQYPISENSSPISFTFWYSLQDEMQAVSTTQNAAVRQQLNNFFFQLITNLLSKAKYPKDNSYSDWTAEEKEQHRIYRIDISDTLMYLLEMLHIDVLYFIMRQLQTAIEQSAASPERPWHEIETCLFGIHSIVETLNESNDDLSCIQSLVNILPQIHVNSLQLADTLIYTIGALTDWLSNHPENLEVLMAIVLPCLNNNDLSLSTVLTLRRLTSECCEHLVPITPSIIQQISTLLTRGVLRNNEETWLMQSAGHLLSVLPQTDCLKHLQNLLILHMHQLEALSKDPQSVPNKNSIIHILDLLSHLFSTLDRRKEDENGELIKSHEEQPAVLILHQLTPILKSILEQWISDVGIMEAFSNLYDKSIRSLVNDFSPLLSPLCEMLTAVLKVYPHTCVLDLAQQIVLVFGADSEHKNTVSLLLSSIVQIILPIYGKGLIKEHPDIGHSFLRLLSHTARKQSQLFKQAATANGLISIADVFHCGIITLRMADSESAKIGSSFFVDFLSLYSEDADIQQATHKMGRDLLALVLHGIGGDAPRTHMDNYADIIQALCRFAFRDFSEWLQELVGNSAILPPDISHVKKAYFVKQLLQSSKSKKRCRDAVKEFTLVCRGLQGTEY
uniref:Importin-13 n=1 Tax=Ciona savignyi TaxID=51511 RepID=H2YAI7_CIOSA